MEVEAAIAKEKGGPAWTAMLDGKVIGCSGVIVLWPGVGYAWAIFTDEIYAHRIWVTRMVRAALRDIVRSLHLHRVEAVALYCDDRNQRWLEALEFQPEGRIALGYTSDKRAVRRYEWVR
jgi:RimJ/RimL family protein N-acetyltransferase